MRFATLADFSCDDECPQGPSSRLHFLQASQGIISILYIGLVILILVLGVIIYHSYGVTPRTCSLALVQGVPHKD